MMNYNYDVLNNTLTVSEKFLKNAGKYNSAEYKLVKALRADNPAMQIVVAKKQTSSQKSLTFKQMEGFIKEVDADKLALFEKVKAISKVQPSPYHYVKTWFENQFPNYTEQFEMDEDGKVHFKKKDDAKATAETPVEDNGEAETISADGAADDANVEDEAISA